MATELLLISTFFLRERNYDIVSSDKTLGRSKSSILILYIDQAFRIGVSKITFMRRSVMDLGFIQRVFDLVGENTCGKARYKFCDFCFVRNM